MQEQGNKVLSLILRVFFPLHSARVFFFFFFTHGFATFHPGNIGLDWTKLKEKLNPKFGWEAAVQKALGRQDTLEEVPCFFFSSFCIKTIRSPRLLSYVRLYVHLIIKAENTSQLGKYVLR